MRRRSLSYAIAIFLFASIALVSMLSAGGKSAVGAGASASASSLASSFPDPLLSPPYATPLDGNGIKREELSSVALDGMEPSANLPKAKLQIARDFTKAGKIVKETSYDEMGKLSGWVNYSYDSRGRILKREYWASEQSSNSVAKTADASSSTSVESSTSKGSSPVLIENYAYDTLGKLLEIRYSDQQGKRGSRLYKWTGRGLLLSESIYDKAQKLFAYISYECDPLGRPVVETHYGADGSKEYSLRLAYDGYGHRSLIERFDAKGEAESKTIYIYSMQDSLISVSRYDKEGKLETETEYTNDLNGNRTGESLRLYEGGKLLSERFMEYSYDKRNNWVSRITREKNIDSEMDISRPVYLERRALSYY